MSGQQLPTARRALRKLHALTKPLCESCPTHHVNRCCAPEFCAGVVAGLEAAGLDVPEGTGHPRLLFMGQDGCVIPPELRPGCTGFVCNEHLSDRDTRRKWERLHRRAEACQVTQAMFDGAGRHSRRILGVVDD